MNNFFQSVMSLPVPFNMIVLIVMIGCATALISSIVEEVRKYCCHRNEVELKREMLDRGMDTEDIERAIRAEIPTAKYVKKR